MTSLIRLLTGVRSMYDLTFWTDEEEWLVERWLRAQRSRRS